MPKLSFTDMLTGAFWLWATTKQMQSRWRLYKAKSWPLVTGAIEHAESKLTPKATGAKPTVLFSYSYQVNGEWYSGEGSLEFGDEDHAAEFTHVPKGKLIDVNVNPSNPADSAVTTEQLKAWPGSARLEESSEPYALPVVMRSSIHVLTLAALGGFAVSLCIHLAAWFGLAVLTPEAILGILLSSFALWFLTVVLAVWLESVSARGWHCTPAWLQYAIYIVWADAGVHLFLALFVETGHNRMFAARSLSSFALLGFMLNFSQLYAAARSRKPRVVEAGIWRQV